MVLLVVLKEIRLLNLFVLMCLISNFSMCWILLVVVCLVSVVVNISC